MRNLEVNIKNAEDSYSRIASELAALKREELALLAEPEDSQMQRYKGI